MGAGVRRVSLVLLTLLGGCERPSEPQDSQGAEGNPAAASEPSGSQVRFEEGDPELMLVWYDEKGVPHTATRVADIPEAQRKRVRVDFLAADSARRAPEGKLWVADVRSAAEGGGYLARSLSREAFDAQLAARASPEEGATPGDADVVLYGTSWCGACRKARQYLRARGVPFADKDIEASPEAQRELTQKARAAGISAGSVPVIDVDGTLVKGFDRQRLDQLLEAR